jgi:hypothetical protein
VPGADDRPRSDPQAPPGGKEFGVVRLRHYDRVAMRHLSPPRVRLEAALVQVAGRARREDDAIAVFADACQERRTTAPRLLAELHEWKRVPHHHLLIDALTDVEAGARSPLEVRYLRHVERAHGLPAGRRQQTARPGRSPQYRDVEYVSLRTLVELNGRLGHEWATDVWDDLDRDLDSATTDLMTLRAGWRQVLQPCRLAGIVGQVLVSRGWAGRPHPCGPRALCGLPSARDADDRPLSRRQAPPPRRPSPTTA